MQANQADFTLTFGASATPRPMETGAGPRAAVADPGAYDRWAVLWRNRPPERGGLARATRAGPCAG